MTTLPVKAVKLPADLAGQTNGKLDARLLTDIPGGQMHHAAATAWLKLLARAKLAGVTLEPTSTVDTYRPYAVQEQLFRTRYDRTPRNTDSKVWNGVRYWLKPGYAMAAVPGTSNHGWGLAIDVKLDSAGKRLAFLLNHAPACGFSWEAQSEPWHIRYVDGWTAPADVPPYRGPYTIGSTGPAVKAIQRGLPGLVVDGIYGPKTRDAVKAYQRRRPALWPANGVTRAGTYRAITKPLM